MVMRRRRHGGSPHLAEGFWLLKDLPAQGVRNRSAARGADREDLLIEINKMSRSSRDVACFPSW